MTEKKESNTIKVEVIGLAEWAKVFPENRDMKGYNDAYVEYDGVYTVNALLDEENIQLLIDAGSQTAENVYEAGNSVGKSEKAKKARAKARTEDGLYRVELRRKHIAPYTFGGAPTVRHADGVTDWVLDEDGLLGNGTKAVFYVSVYEVKGLKGTRLDGVQVIDHVPYESDYVPGPRMKDYSKTEESKSAPKPSEKVDNIVDDEIPFDFGGAP